MGKGKGSAIKIDGVWIDGASGEARVAAAGCVVNISRAGIERAALETQIETNVTTACVGLVNFDREHIGSRS